MSRHFPLHVSLFDGSYGAAHLIDLLNIFFRFFFNFICQSFHVIGTCQRVNGIRHAAFVGNQLLCAQGQCRRFFRRQRQRFVVSAAGHRLDTAQNCGHGLPGNTGHIVQGLLRRQHGTGSVNVHAKHLGFGNRSAIAFLHDTGPQSAGCAEFGDFKEEVQTCGKDPTDAGSEIIHFLTGLNCRINVGDSVCESKGDFLHFGRSGFTDMVCTDADGVPLRNVFGTIFKGVGDQAHGRTGRENISAPGDVLFQNIVLNRTTQLFRLYALLLRNCHIHGQQYCSRPVDRHGGGNLIQRYTVKQLLHVGQ